jgi:glycosyltransferase involved in cell wall biosynthesis
MILDGGSTDGSKAIVERYADYLTYWRSTPDKGQSSAIADGMIRATGDLAGWLNSDDVLLPGALDAIGTVYLENPNGGLFAGNLMFMIARIGYRFPTNAF